MESDCNAEGIAIAAHHSKCDLHRNPAPPRAHFTTRRVAAAKCASTAAWRNSLIAKFPHNSARNVTARDLLRTIAVMSENDVSLATKERLSQCNIDLLVKTAEESCRLVGFKFLPRSLDKVVIDIVARMPSASDTKAVA